MNSENFSLFVVYNFAFKLDRVLRINCDCPPLLFLHGFLFVCLFVCFFFLTIPFTDYEHAIPIFFNFWFLLGKKKEKLSAQLKLIPWLIHLLVLFQGTSGRVMKLIHIVISILVQESRVMKLINMSVLFQENSKRAMKLIHTFENSKRALKLIHTLEFFQRK